MRVHCIIAALNPAQLTACTLNFASIRIGFPTAKLNFQINGNCVEKDVVRQMAEANGLVWNQDISQSDKTWFHADWIEKIFEMSIKGLLVDPEEPYVIVDGDTIFYDNIESMVFDPRNTYANQLSGMYIPAHHNVWSDCISAPRLHTSLQGFKNPKVMLNMLKNFCPRAFDPYGEYCGFNPFQPTMVVNKGVKTFYDSTSLLYQSLGGYRFEEPILRRYDHINSSCFYDEMCKRFYSEEEGEGFKLIHELVRNGQVSELKGLNKNVIRFYQDREVEW